MMNYYVGCSAEEEKKLGIKEPEKVKKVESAEVEGGKVVFEVNIIPAELQAAVKEVASIVDSKEFRTDTV